jgi:hypothetical protein
MTSNDPRRKNRSGDPRKQGNDGAAAGPVSVPAFPGSQGPNGHPAPTGQPAKIAQAVAQALAEVLPNVLGGTFYQVLSQTPVRIAQLPCYECKLARMQWLVRHEQKLQVAHQAYMTALSQMAPDDPRRGMISPVAFLPPELKPSGDPANPNPQAMPDLNDSTVMVGGTLYCDPHMPGAPDQVTKRPYLIASANMSPAMLAELARI